MAYNNRNHLERVEKMQKLYKEKQADGYPTTTIYYRFVKDEFNISIATYYRWLTIPASRELKKLKNKEQQ